ncbi:hypothetical protein BD626DRAFT_507936 [Schizophyllum amplum]|uniref:F-box domain-containing protein n=1 Tax=Schizophyllum amplum TaxID=97359 RepID=A0A550C4E2_9AGAR|nr:hypothetical protein BD626DRAFT_507936 [Auriculariopsis ampla]
MEALPADVLDIVLAFVDDLTLERVFTARAVRVSRLWYELGTKYLWKSVHLLAVLRLLPDDAWCFCEREHISLTVSYSNASGIPSDIKTSR